MFFYLFALYIVDFMRNLGSAWLLIGRLRYCLLTSYTYLDPTVKYTVKLSQLTEKIASLQLENEVFFLFSFLNHFNLNYYFSASGFATSLHGEKLVNLKFL